MIASFVDFLGWVFFAAPILGVLLAFLMGPLGIQLAVYLGVLDYPSSRKQHDRPIPCLGGLVIYLGFFIPVLLLLPLTPLIGALLLGATGILILGIWDDMLGLDPRFKLIAQVLLSLVPIYMGVQIYWVTSPFGGVIQLGMGSMPVTILWIVAMVNVINILDGLDGLATGITAISCGATFLVAGIMMQWVPALLALILMAVCLGFLRVNFFPARLYLGDSGSMLLGFLLGVISISGVIKSTVAFSFLLPILILAIPISDTLYAIIRRVRNKKAIFQADRGHFHHELLALGYHPVQVVLGMYLVSVIFSMIAIALALPNPIWRGYSIWIGITVFISMLCVTVWSRHFRSIGLVLAKYWSQKIGVRVKGGSSS